METVARRNGLANSNQEYMHIPARTLVDDEDMGSLPCCLGVAVFFDLVQKKGEAPPGSTNAGPRVDSFTINVKRRDAGRGGEGDDLVTGLEGVDNLAKEKGLAGS